MIERISPDGTGRAIFSNDEKYRYWLGRDWNIMFGGLGRVCWLLLNPSTADEMVLDPTLSRCKTFSQRWGYDGMIVVNLFGLRSTAPAALLDATDPVGPENDAYILDAMRASRIVIAGWGGHASVRRHDREASIAAIAKLAGRVLHALAAPNTDGSPRHPLYLPKAAAMREHRSTV